MDFDEDQTQNEWKLIVFVGFLVYFSLNFHDGDLSDCVTNKMLCVVSSIWTLRTKYRYIST